MQPDSSDPIAALVRFVQDLGYMGTRDANTARWERGGVWVTAQLLPIELRIEASDNSARHFGIRPTEIGNAAAFIRSKLLEGGP